MHETDIARTRRQIEKVAEKADEITENAEVINDSGFDASSSSSLLAKQRELVQLLGQALADFNELTNRAEVIERSRINYEPSLSDFSVTYDKKASEVAIEYTGSEDIDVSDVTVNKAESEVSVFSSTLTTGTTATVDTSDMVDGESVEVEVITYRQTPDEINLKSWNEITGSSTAPEISVTGIELPEHNLVSEMNTLTKSVTIGATESTV